MTGQYKINDVDVYTEWGIVFKKGVFSQLLQFPERKDLLSKNWIDQNGTERDETPTFQSSESSFDILFIANSEAEFWSNYESFYTFILSSGYFMLESVQLDRKFIYLYKKMSPFVGLTPLVSGGNQVAAEFTLTLINDDPGENIIEFEPSEHVVHVNRGEKGEPGPEGPAGPAGPKGDPGPAGDGSSIGNWLNDYKVATLLRWQNYGNGHVIFDASSGVAPDGAEINSQNPGSPWQQTFPTLMGWNGTYTYGVRVDSARVADSATIWGGREADFGSFATTLGGAIPIIDDVDGKFRLGGVSQLRTWLGLGASAYQAETLQSVTDRGNNFSTRLRVNNANQWIGDGTMTGSSNPNDLGFRNDLGNIFFAAGVNIGLVMNQSGNVGIGTASPNFKLSFGMPSNGRTLGLWESGTDFWGLGTESNSVAIYAGGVSSSAIAVFKNDGNVGIGTSSPNFKLHVAGAVKSDTRIIATTALSLDGTDTDNWAIKKNGSAVDFSLNGAVVMKLDADGLKLKTGFQFYPDNF